MVEEGGVICDGDGLLDKSRGCDDELDGRSVIVVSLRNVRLGLRLRPLLIFGRDRWRVSMLIDCSDEKIYVQLIFMLEDFPLKKGFTILILYCMILSG